MSLGTTLRLARPGAAAFAAMGMVWGSFAADLPDVKAMLGVDEQRLGLLLFLTPFAAVASMLATPWTGAWAGRRALLVASLIMCAAFQLPGHFASVWVFPLAMLACGAGTGMTDVLLSARISAVENTRGVHLMNLCHAAYSFGYAGAAIATGQMRTAGWSPAWVLGTIAAAAAVVALATYETDGTVHGLRRKKDRVRAGLDLMPLIGGGMVAIAYLSENAAENWSALHIEQTLGGSPANGAMGPAALALTMGVSRLVGQSLAQRVSSTVVLTAGAGIASIGSLTAALAATPAIAYLGFIVMGAGASVLVPTSFSLIGRLADPETRTRAIARATMLGYFGYFIGPPVVGIIAGQLGLRAAFVFAAAAFLTIPLMNRVLRNIS